MTFSIRDADDALAQLREAVDQRRSAVAAREDLEALSREVNRKAKELRQEMGERFDPVEWNRLYNAFPEEQNIARIHDHERDANAHLLETRKRLHALLDPLRSRQTAELINALDAVPWDVREESTVRYVHLAESILASGTSKRSKRAGSRNEQLTKLKRQLRTYWIELEKPAYKDFCERLDARGISLPDSVEWRKYLKWASAFEKSQGAVSRWLSEVVHSDN
jgi:hypothetical protein